MAGGAVADQRDANPSKARLVTRGSVAPGGWALETPCHSMLMMPSGADQGVAPTTSRTTVDDGSRKPRLNHHRSDHMKKVTPNTAPPVLVGDDRLAAMLSHTARSQSRCSVWFSPLWAPGFL